MIQDIAPKKFYNPIRFDTITAKDKVVLFDERSVLIQRNDQNELIIPSFYELKEQKEEKFQYAFSIDQTRYFIKKAESSTAQDEFGVLEKSMDRMSAQLEDLIEREYKAQVQQAQLERETNQARFLALQSQVNPHFMFNALESIRLKARVKGEIETAQMIKYMAKMFRNLIEWDDNIITVREEIAFLDEFLHIQEYRFEDEFSYEIHVQEEAYECKIPKMILQPLVENACVHGLEAIEDKRLVGICVTADFTKNMLYLQVEDNGGGMTAEKLEALKVSFQENDEKGKSVGLKNVYRRLSLYYGDRMTFDIESVVGKGTICRICIPL